MSYKGIDWGEVSIFAKVMKLAEEGRTLKEIGEEFGVTRQRMAQVFDYYKLDPVTCGVKIKPRLSREDTARMYFYNR